MLKLIIDNNEKGYIKKYYQQINNDNDNNTIIEFRTLILGDILIEYTNETGNIIPLILIERKTEEDLAASIQSKRHRNQKIRLLQLQKENPNLKIWYLIEGFKYSEETLPENIGRSRISKDTVLSSIINTIIRDNFYCIMCNDTFETIEFINKLYNKIKKEHISLLTKNNNDNIKPQNNSNQEYLETIQINKKDNINSNSCMILQLAQIPGISIGIAKKIQDVYPNMISLCNTYNELGEDIKKKEKLLYNIKGIGLVISKKVYSFLCV
jgi:ERCC4-type nuclease